jgi:hypothetical protein
VIDGPVVNALLGQIALIAVMATLGLAWSLCEGYVEYRRRNGDRR